MLIHSSSKALGLRKERGAALVEFAIVSILLFTLVLGIIDFGLMIKDYLALSQIAREGARHAALGAPDGYITEPDSVQRRMFDWGKSLGISNLTDDDIIVNFHELSPTSREVEVRVEHDYKMISGSFFGIDTVRLGSTMVMRQE